MRSIAAMSHRINRRTLCGSNFGNPKRFAKENRVTIKWNLNTNAAMYHRINRRTLCGSNFGNPKRFAKENHVTIKWNLDVKYCGYVA
ncbi:hypothetical protein [Aquirufa regiilacus]